MFQRPAAIPRPGGHFPQTPTPSAVCTYRGPRDHRYCAVFGDPHLWTFDGTHDTCRMNGAWPLVDNAYLSVQVTSETLPGGGTAIAKVSALFVSLHHDITSHPRITVPFFCLTNPLKRWPIFIFMACHIMQKLDISD